MNRHSGMGQLNPYIVCGYYFIITLILLTVKNPVITGIMLVEGIIMSLFVAGIYPTLLSLAYGMIIGILMVLVNPLVSHEGESIIWGMGSFIITAESLIYGMSSALMLIAVIIWFCSFNTLMTSDKYIYVFGRVLPGTALLISLTLRLIPELNRQYAEERISLISLGIYDTKTLRGRMKLSYTALRGVIVHSIEASSLRADSMTARGYGIRHRSCYLECKWRLNDSIYSILGIIAAIAILILNILSGESVVFYPRFNLRFDNTYIILLTVLCGLYGMLPIIYEIKERILWKRYLSRISQ